MPKPNYFSSKPWFQKRNSNSNNNTSSFTDVHFVDCSPAFGYYGFKCYFPETEDIDLDTTLNKVQAVEDYVNANSDKFVLPEVEKKHSIFIDIKALIADQEFVTKWTDFNSEITVNTEYCLNCMSLAIHQTLMKRYEESVKDEEQILGYSLHICNIRARIYNYEPILQLKNLKTNNYGKLVAVRGTVMKVGTRTLICQYLIFKCKLCSGTQIVKQENWQFTLPTKCPTKGCRTQSGFLPMFSSTHTKTVDRQALRIQELVNDAQCENGRVPRTYECELTEDLLNCCVPGDDITITGILKRKMAPETKGKNKQVTIFSFYLDAVSVINNKNDSQAGQIIFNTTDYYAIKKIHEEPILFRLLVQSLCPVIYRHEIIKAGLLLAMFGGTDDSKYDVRPLSHVLMMGDPGLGKSQMLQACTLVAPRGVYVCGKTSTSSGLTVTVTKDAGGEYALEAGALVLADQGVCCIDEFDKIPAQHESLLESMEQQSISIAKAGIICTLPTRTTILAAANPTGGHYNKAKTIAENLKMKPAMLSRFDLIFILLDQPDAEFDELLPKHVLRLHMDPRHRNLSNRAPRDSSEIYENEKLMNRLRIHPDENLEPLPHPLLRKYIAYAQKYVKPKLCQEAKDVLKKYYLGLRKQYQDGDNTPVAVRQLYSLIRLTQARAKMELREEATKSDALDVVEIMQHCLASINCESKSPSGGSTQQHTLKSTSRNQINKLLNIVKRQSEAEERKIFSFNELEDLCDNAGIPQDKVHKTIDSLNHEGFFLDKGSGNYQLVSSNFI